MNTDKETEMSLLVTESIGKCVLDCACIRSVAGEMWLKTYKDMLSEKDLQLIKYEETSTVFRFGDGAESVNQKLVHLPATIGKTFVMIEVAIVNNDIPLLLSTEAMMKAKMRLDFGTKKVRIFNEWFDLQRSSSDHLMIPLCPLAGCRDDQIVLHVKKIGYSFIF